MGEEDVRRKGHGKGKGKERVAIIGSGNWCVAAS